MKTDYTAMTTEALEELNDVIRSEIKRRTKEQKLPVFVVDGVAYKNIDEAIDELIKDINMAKNCKGGAAVFFREKISGHDLSVCFCMSIEHWSISEYNARPDRVW